MNIKWLVQNKGFSSVNKDYTEDVLNNLNFNYEIFGISKLINYVIDLDKILNNPEDSYIIRGGTSLLTMLNKVNNLKEVNPQLTEEQLKYSDIYIQNLKNGIFYDENNFDQNYYTELDLPLLNNKAKKLNIKEYINQKFDKDYFVKPSKDQKAFNAGILPKGVSIKEFVESQLHEKEYINEIAILADIKHIFAEYRFFVVNKEVITYSQYMSNHSLFLDDKIPSYILAAAKEYALLYQPNDIFTMDLADTKDGVKIIEYNCWNASGLYKTNVPKIFNEVNDYMIAKNQKKLNFKFNLIK